MRIALVLAVALLTSGCGDNGSPSTDSTSVSGVATYESTGTGGDAALLTGTVAFDDGCLYVEADGGRVLPVFPVDEVETADNTLTYGQDEYSDGDQIDLGGGTLSRTSEVLAAAAMPDGCTSEDRYWLVAQTD